MARPTKKGLSFFQLEVDALNNKKVRLLQSDHGEKGVLIWLHILSYAYKENGYYFDLNNQEEVEHFATETCKCNPQHFTAVVGAALKRKLFVQSIFEGGNVLTCEDMQDTYLQATAERRKKGTIISIKKEFLCDTILGNRYECPVNIRIDHGNNSLSSWELEQNPVNNSQRKGKEKKGNEIKEEESEERTPNSFFQKGEEEKKRERMPPPKNYSEVLGFYDEVLTKIGIDTGFIRSASQKFWNHYESVNWKINGIDIFNWQARAREWMADDLKKVKS